MKKILFVLIIIFLQGCSSLTVNTLNENFKRKLAPLTPWDEPLLRFREEGFKQLNINLLDAKSLYMIETYNIENNYYDCAICLNENQYFKFVKLHSEARINILYSKLTATENFIFTKIKESKMNEIKHKSKASDIMSPGFLYITIVKRKPEWKSIKVLRLQEFQID